MADADIHFYFDPVCPFAWMTSKWIRTVVSQRGYQVDWRFISLRILNADVDYSTHFPPGYEDGHTTGLRLLRVAAQVRDEHGSDKVGDFYEAAGKAIFDSGRGAQKALQGGLPASLEPILAAAGLPAGLTGALDDDGRDRVIAAETEEALSRTGRDVGTPIIHFEPPEGVAFFGPVISRLPSETDAAALWDHVVALARFPGFAEFKRSLREVPQLAAFGVATGEAGVEEDWKAGSRRR